MHDSLLFTYIIEDTEEYIHGVIHYGNTFQRYYKLSSDTEYNLYSMYFKEYHKYTNDIKFSVKFPNNNFQYYIMNYSGILLHNEFGPAVVGENGMPLFYIVGNAWEFDTYYNIIKTEYRAPEENLFILKLKYG